MKIAFVSGNREKLPDAVVPLGLLYVMAATPARHERILIDLCFEDQPAAALGRELARLQPELIALGMRNIQNNDYSGTRDNIAYYGELISAARRASSAPIALGGAGFSVLPGALMQRLRPDYGISGEGERTFPQLVAALEAGGDPARLASIANLHRLQGDALLVNPPDAQFLDMNALRLPERRLADPRYYEHYGIESIQTKRGCPLHCQYCTYPQIEGRIGRARDPHAVADEMFAALEQQPGIRHFFIVDSVFNLPRTHAKNVCRALIERGWQLPWTCYANPLGFDREFAELARAAGCSGMEIGSDSGCDEVLRRLRKGFSTAQIRALHALCAEAGIPDCHTFILGTQGETLDDAKRTLEFAAELDPFSAVLMIWVDDQEALEPELRAQRERLREQIRELLRACAAEQPHWSMPPLGIGFDAQLFRRLRRAGLHGPLWQHSRGARRAAPRPAAQGAASAP